jgi:hypothetical protein
VLGGSIELALEFVNVTQSPIYVWRTDDFGPQAIDIVARRDACVYHMKPMHWASLVSERATRRMRLFAGNRRWQKLTLDNPVAFGSTLSLPGPGAYMFRATFRSEGSGVDGGQNSFWRGFVQSPEVRIVVRSPSMARTVRNRASLRTSVRTKYTDLKAVEYFQVVKDPIAADLLVELLRREPDNTAILDAVAHQGRLIDVTALDTALEATSERVFREYTMKLAQRLRFPDPCD